MRVLLFLCVLSGCFKPSYDHPACGPNRECPSGFSCNTQDVCERPGGGDDDAFVPKDSNSTTDTPPGAYCLGSSGGLFVACFPTAPTGALSISSNLDTGIANPMCDAVASNASVCVVASGQITVPGGALVRVTGPRALVLASASTMTMVGTLDLGSTSGSPGAGSALVACPAGNPPQDDPNGAGGGAGGSFVQRGAPGAAGTGLGGAPGASIAAVTMLRGGCSGQDGGAGTGSRAQRGAGGGGVYLVAATSIVISGTITAGGQGGEGGMSSGPRSGGAGGGSGGVIGLDAPTVTVTGAVLAGGGGGGEGSGQAPGASGQNAGAARNPAAGGAGVSTSGGDGGNGGYSTTLPTAGMTGSLGGGGLGGGGGGGGGVGVIKVVPAGALSGGGVVAPPPS